ncbi:MAG: hypothetical protein JO261_05375 [Alphaproteobacteria bacterium]|nr:hypothetical protein [Alphaproteobacteria bacterium]MBV9693112.1 hypothetical protein [Alphaproteobacteria bacterium]
MSAPLVPLTSFDPSTLLGYYQSRLPVAPQQSLSATAAKTNSATAHDALPWESTPPDKQARDAEVLSATSILDTRKVPLSATSADAKTEEDNQKLFSLYSAVNNLSYLAGMAHRDGMTTGQLAGFNSRFQSGLQQLRDFVAKTSFNNFTLQATAPSASATSSAGVAFGSFTYGTRTLTTDANQGTALPGLDPSQRFTITVKKGDVSTDVFIDLSQANGPLTIDNLVSTVNRQLSAAGFSSRLHKVLTKGTLDDPKTASYGMQVAPAGSETLSFSSPDAAPALYVAGNSGLAAATSKTPADQQGRLVKLADLSSTQTASFSATARPTSGLTTAAASVVDGDGNVYVVGNATGDFGKQINQASQDVYITKYDSAGNVTWTRMLGSAGTASGYGLALDPLGGVVVSGSTTAQLGTTAVGDGNTDSFVARYDANGGQSWVKQVQTLADNQAASVSVDASGSIYVGGQVKGVVGSGQTNGGGSDAYLVKLDAKGNIVAEHQYGSSGNDAVAATAVTSNGGLIVASTINGDAVISKYADGDLTQPPIWQKDLGALQAGGAITSIIASNGRIYVAGTTANGALTANGEAAVAVPGSGGTDAFVAALTDNGQSASTDTVTYAGTAASEQGNALTVGADGTVYLAGTTGGTFAGQARNNAATGNLFVSAIARDGSIAWTRQYGGADGASTGQAIAFDPQGASVLDALGLPRGTLTLNQTVDLTQATTLRAGDSFSIQIQGATTRTAKITIDRGETLGSLTAKINIELQNAGKASIAYGSGSETLKIAVNPGVTASLLAGSRNFDALARLGLSPQTLTAPASNAKTASAHASTQGAAKAYGLGLPQDMDISTASGGGAARAQLLSVLSTIQKIYQSENKPAAAAATPFSATTSAAAQNASAAQIQNYSTALNVLAGMAPGTGGSLF